MTRILDGERIGATAALKIGAAAAIFDEQRERILLTQRADNGQWCLPSGGMEPGESIAEACAREIWEEVGLAVHIVRLIGVYSSPHRITEYADGNRFQFVSLLFEAEPLERTVSLNEECVAWGYFTLEEASALDMLDSHRERLPDAFERRPVAFFR
jgi:8-oxo-dGTP pyrophosphatase MutT (NUDIX family)